MKYGDDWMLVSSSEFRFIVFSLPWIVNALLGAIIVVEFERQQPRPGFECQRHQPLPYMCGEYAEKQKWKMYSVILPLEVITYTYIS